MIDQKQQQIYQLLQKLIVSPSQLIYCHFCRREIQDFIKFIDCQQLHYYCSFCFSNLNPCPSQYHIMRQLDYPLIDKNWTAKEELLLFEGIQKHGFSNWADIAEHIKSKSKEEVQNHYLDKYICNNSFLPAQNILTTRSAEGVLIYQHISSKTNKSANQPAKTFSNFSSILPKRSSKGNKSNSKIGKSPSQVIGYLPKRGDFEIQYDNDAQFLLAEMQFNEEDDPSETAMKFRLIDIYNHKLNQRIIRKEFVVSRKLLDSREQTRLDKTRTKEEKEIYNIMKVFARFNSCEDHERIVQSIIKEKQIRQRIEELKQLKKRGIRTFGQVQDELDNKKKKDDKSKKRQTDYTDKTRRVRKDNFPQRTQKKVIYINKDEEELCKQLNMTFKQFAFMKQRILKESVRVGLLKGKDIFNIFDEEKDIVGAVFDFLVKHEDLIVDQEGYQGKS